MKKHILTFLFLILILTGCSSKNYSNGNLNVLNWSSYIPDSIIKDFEQEYNIKVNYGTYSSNEELLAKITSSKEGTYDLIFPSDYMVELMINKNIIQKIDKSKINNIYNLNNLFLDQGYDPNNKYSLPFLATTVVIAINRDNIQDKITGYSDLLNPKYKNNIVLLDDQRIIIGLALQTLGYSQSETDPQKLKEAKIWLLKLKNNIKAFDSDSPKTFLITGEADIGIMWSAEAELAKAENPHIEIIHPEEGYAISVDNYALVSGAKNTTNAYLFINYLLKDNISEKIVSEYPYISPNYNVNKIPYYSLKNILSKGSYIKNIGANITLYDKLWAEIK